MTAQATEVERASQEDVLGMIDDGGVVDAIAAVTRWSAQELRDLAKENGYAVDAASKRFRPRVRQGRDKCHTCQEVDHLTKSGESPEAIARRLGLSLSTITRHLYRHESPHRSAFNSALRPWDTQTDGGAVSPETSTEARAGATPVSPTRPTPVLRDVIAEGKAHSSVKVQRAAVKAEVALATLVGLLDATRAEEAAKRKAEAEKAEARAEVERLERQLAEAKAKLRGPARAAAVAVVAPNQAGASAKDIRAWAAGAGVDCPSTGRVPGAVVDAYLAAHQDGAA